MASTSTSSVQKRFKYDVFLSFRGEDTRKTFVDHLYHALVNRGITTYKDDEKIEKGKRIDDQLITSIEESRFYIIVFSKTYASSSWCLEELVKIMECQKMTEHTAYPIFYDVEPTEVRHQSGAVGEAFERLTRKRTLEHPVEKDDVGRRRNALKEAADLAGMELKNTFNGHEAKFIQKIVQDVSLMLHFFSSSIDGKLVGMETRVKDIVSSLELGCDDVRMIGIKGIGGGGKTTLARAVYDYISVQFEGKSFVENVREVLKGSMSGLKELQKQILSTVFNDSNIVVSGVLEGENMMKKMMPSRRVLVVLDDVDDIEQLDALAGEHSWFKPGSRIIITTRDTQVLYRANFIYEVSLLSYDEAMCLFSSHAFGREIPNHRLEELSRKVIRYASGLPLTIKVLGSHLCGRSERDWEDTIERLKIIPLDKTLKKLEISYNGLENDQKEMFLHIACILRGERKKRIINILESCGFHAHIGLSVLEQKSLITINKEYSYYDEFCSDIVLLHDHIEEMGRNIVRRLHPDEPKRHSRLWINKEIEDILVNDSGTKEIKCIKLIDTNLDASIIMKGLKKMKKLEVLYMKGIYSTREVDEANYCLPDALRYVNWLYFPFCWLPKTFQANNLVNLVMPRSNITQLWVGGERKVLNNLKFLNLNRSKLRMLDLGMTPHLEELYLEGCTEFVELHMPFEFSDLKYLKLTCSKVSSLNLGLTPNIERLYLEECSCLQEIQAPVGCLKKLVYLTLRGSSRFHRFSIQKHGSADLDSIETFVVDVRLVVKCPLHPHL